MKIRSGFIAANTSQLSPTAISRRFCEISVPERSCYPFTEVAIFKVHFVSNFEVSPSQKQFRVAITVNMYCYAQH